MAQNAEERNAQIHKLLNKLLKQHDLRKSSYAAKLSKEIESLFSTHIWGHREIVLTILMARLLNPKYKASEDFYACNPRSIFEKPIRKFLREHGIPHKKSGPLNVAKNILKINEDWAANKRGDEVAMNVVRIVKVIEKLKLSELFTFTSIYTKRYAKEATRVKKMNHKPAPSEDPIHLASLCQALIDDVPDGGATPQAIVGLLIEASNEDRGGTATVSGHLDSVSTTNTTSKKAGDIIENLIKGHFVYEVTVKRFDLDRLRESYEALKADKEMTNVKEVFVVCRSMDMYPEA